MDAWALARHRQMRPDAEVPSDGGGDPGERFPLTPGSSTSRGRVAYCSTGEVGLADAREVGARALDQDQPGLVLTVDRHEHIDETEHFFPSVEAVEKQIAMQVADTPGALPKKRAR